MNKVSYIGYVLMLVGVATFLMAILSEPAPDDSYNPLLYTTYFCVIVAVGLALISAVAGLIINPKSVKTSLIGFGALIALAIVSYVLSGDEVLESYGEITATVSKLSDMGLFAMTILLVGAIASIVFSGIYKMLS